jgi:two-component system alkaline phosphatase synthesis response regulator PhoP
MQKTAFVVEDDDNIREIVKCTLSSCNIEVLAFEDAVEMFGAVSQTKPDVILLDLMLPRMDGLDALKKLKSATATASVPVIILTAKSSETDKVRGLDLGADDYITKPFGILELMARVRAALRRCPDAAGEEDVFEYDGLCLDNSRHEVTLDGRRIELTLKEFDLLKFLMENSGRAVRRDEILDEVWGYGYAGESRTLDMHIRSLRQKLGCDTGEDSLIATVRGIGYKFNS